MSDRTIHIGVNVILKQDNKVLFGKRLNTAGAGTWGVPGGHLEPGESLQAGAKRELEEETGIVADELVLTSVINQPRQSEGTSHYIQFVFLVEKFHGELENREPETCSEWQWFDLNDLPKEIFFAHKDFIPALLQKTLLVDSK